MKLPTGSLLLLLICGLAVAPAPGAAPAKTLRIVYTAETHGNLLPCACPERALGGLARRIGFIDSLRIAGDGSALVVDAGAFFATRADYPLLPEGGMDDLRELLVAAANTAGYDAVAVDSRVDLPPESPTPWLLPNEARLVRKADLSIALAAVSERLDPGPCKESIHSLGPSDAVVLLCSGDLHFAKMAARKVGATIAVVARGARFETPLVEDGVLYLGPGRSGKYVGVAECRIGRGPRVGPAFVRLRAMDGTTPLNLSWSALVESAVLRIEIEDPMAFRVGE